MPQGDNFEFFNDGDALRPRSLFHRCDPPNDQDSSTTANEVTMASSNVLMEHDLHEGPQETMGSKALGHNEISAMLNPDNVQKKRRSRLSFAKKFIYATRNFYLKQIGSMLPLEATPELVGQVVGCPSKKNGNQYEIKWIRERETMHWPATLDRENVQTIFHKDQIQSLLSRLIMQCDMNNIIIISQPHVFHTEPLMEERVTTMEQNTATAPSTRR